MSSASGLLTLSGKPFATGASEYLDARPGIPEDRPRIYVKFRPQGTGGSFLGLLDTGGHFCILNQQLIDLVQDLLTDHLGEAVLRTAHGVIRGELFILPIELIAEMGDHLDLDVVVFVTPDWQGPSFIGYSGVLDRLRFAVDPPTNRFYFGNLP